MIQRGKAYDIITMQSDECIDRAFIFECPTTTNQLFFGFRSRKAMKNQENWDRVQKLFAELFEKVFRYTLMVSVVIFAMDIAFLIVGYDNLLLTSVISQAIILFVLYFAVYWHVNRQLN
ncbi:Uncharacterised protein [Staphylococcus microti]|uniref:Uncharacterized protein n=3 Tax=Staphylococcus microti TaxID=569857 RepID=A0A380GQU5_9STAP|nr:Uncharacterised protein [Staphylococcus microti]